MNGASVSTEGLDATPSGAYRRLRAGALPRRVADMLSRTTYEQVIDRAWFIADDQLAFKRLADNAKAEVASYVRTISDAGERETEELNVPRLCCNWRNKGVAPFRDTTSEGLTVRNGSQAEALQPHMAALFDAFAGVAESEDVKELVAEATYPTNTSKGAPFFSTGRNRDALPLQIALTLAAESAADIEAACLDAGGYTKLAALNLYRIQDTGKRRDVVYADRSGRPHYAGTTEYACKVRRVWGFPAVLNFWHARPYEAIAAILKRIRTINGVQVRLLPAYENAIALGREMDAAYPDGPWVAEDISSHDTSVGAELLSLIARELETRQIEYLMRRGALDRREGRLAIDIGRFALTIPLIAPPLSHDEEARWVERAGALISGLRKTSAETTEIRYLSVAAACAAAGVKPALIMCFGDDTIIKFKTREDGARYSREAAAFDDGFKRTVAPSPIFLQKYFPSGVGQVVRMAMGTMQKEAGREPGSITIAALGIAARRAVLSGSDRSKAVYTSWCADALFGERMRTANELAAKSAYDVATLGRLVAADVGGAARRSGTQNEDSDDELARTLEKVSYAITDERQKAAILEIYREINARSEEPVTTIIAQARVEREAYGPKMLKRIVRQESDL